MSTTRIFKATLSEGVIYIFFFPDEILWLSTNATIGGKKIPVFFKAKEKDSTIILTCEPPKKTNVDVVLDKLGSKLMDEILNDELELAPWEGSIILESDPNCLEKCEE
jgi:hypothetical protein